MHTNPLVNALVETLLEHPGDVAARLALADLAEDWGKPCPGLRSPGSWEISWVRKEKQWHLLCRHDVATSTTGGLWGRVKIVCLPRRLLPRCSVCPRRAHGTHHHVGGWVCDRFACMGFLESASRVAAARHAGEPLS